MVCEWIGWRFPLSRDHRREWGLYSSLGGAGNAGECTSLLRTHQRDNEYDSRRDTFRSRHDHESSTCGVLFVDVPQTSTVSIEFGLDTNYGLQTSAQSIPTGGGQLNILVAGMRASTPYHMRAVAQLPDGSQFTDSDHVFTTAAIPSGLVPNVVAATTPGMTPTAESRC